MTEVVKAVDAVGYESAQRGGSLRLSDMAYDSIRQKIITLELPPLSAIDEAALTEDLQLGRTPIREALQRLAGEGLVFSSPRRGTFVSGISITDLQKIFEARVVLEAFCARLVARRATSAQLERIEAVTGQLQQVSNGDNQALMIIDEQFHELLYQAADNEFLADSLRRLHALSFRLWYLFLDRLGDVRGAMNQHIAIAQALRDRDEDRAEALLRQHVVDFHGQMKAVL